MARSARVWRANGRCGEEGDQECEHILIMHPTATAGNRRTPEDRDRDPARYRNRERSSSVAPKGRLTTQG